MAVPIWNPKKQVAMVTRPRTHLREKTGDRSQRKWEITSIGNLQKVEGNLIRVARDMRRQGVTLQEMTRDQAQAWLDRLPARGYEQDTISSYKVALGHCLHRYGRPTDLKSPRAFVGPGPKETQPRAIPRQTARLVRDQQPERMRLTTDLIEEEGWRAHEVLTLRKASEIPKGDKIWTKMARRQWNDDRWAGRDGVRYVVVGKNGLPRISVLSETSAQLVEERRLPAPRAVHDRGIPYIQYYDLPGGQAWSMSWTRAAQAVLGESPGGHCLRHNFAHDRMDWYLEGGYSWDEARERIAQEMGHFRPSSVDKYLRAYEE